MIRVEMLGRFSILAPDGEVSLPTIKVRMLAAYLFWQQGSWARRELLRGMLWGDVDEDRAARNLRTALYLMRRALATTGTPDNLLEVRRDAVRVVARPDCMVDARLFEHKALAGLRENDWEVELLMEAASLYRGPFLEDLDAEWSLSERRRLADLHLAVLRALVHRLSALSFHEAAVSYATQWLTADPLDEAAHQTLMRLYATLGQPRRVLEQFEQCREVLKKELGVSPSDVTVDLVHKLVPNGEESSTTRSQKSASSRRPTNSGIGSRELEELPIGERLSTDPLRNARLLLVSGEAMALMGETKEGIKSLEKALTFFDRFSILAARARLMLGEALIWLSIPLTPKLDNSLRDKGLRYIEEALQYYRANGPPADLERALQLGAQACWLAGLNSRAVELAQEGLSLAVKLGDREAEGRLAAVLAICLREKHRLAEAVAVFDRALQSIPYMGTPWEILWMIFQRGILSYIIGDLAEAERFLQEALTIIRATTFPSLMVKVGECMTRSMMIVVLHYQDKPSEMDGFLKPEMDKYNPEPFVYLNTLFAASEARRSLLPGVEGWLRARLLNLPSPMIACTIRSVVEEMLAAGLFREAARWAGVGIRLARIREWGAFEALFYCHRSVALLKQGQHAAAAVCRKRVEQLADPFDRWTRAWLARVDGLLSWAQGQPAGARLYLGEAKRLFLRIGSRYDARQVQNDLRNISKSVDVTSTFSDEF